jgi:hypothetical protein
MQTRDELQPLFAHRKRPLWGLAILAREGDDERHYQFQDGQLRTFKRGYYELLQEVADHPPERALDIVRDLRAMLRLDGREGRKPSERGPSFGEQLRAFEALYPAGFADARWIEQVRGDPGVPSKQHREPVLMVARGLLAREAIDALLAAGDVRGVLERARAVVNATDLVGSKDVALLRKLRDVDEPAMAHAIRELVAGSAPHAERLSAFLAVLSAVPGARVGWPLATVLPALVDPSAHLFVKPTLVRQQAQWIAPTVSYDASPSAPSYERLRTVGEAVRSRLVRAGHAPRDLLDVHDFMRETLRARPRSVSAVGDPPEGGERAPGV